MTLANGLRELYPDIRDEQFIVRDDSDGRGPRLTYLDPALGSMPEKAAIEAAAIVHRSIPKDISVRRLKLALFDASLLAELDTVVAAMNPRQQLDFSLRVNVPTRGGIIRLLRTQLGYTPRQMVQLLFDAKDL